MLKVYVSQSRMLHILEEYCIYWWYFSWAYFELKRYKKEYWMEVKFNKSLWKRILQNKYMKVVIWHIEWYDEKDFDSFFEEYCKELDK
jgi:hypothetical protein